MPSRVIAAQALLDRGWGKAPIQIDLNVKAKFDDFLREVNAEVIYDTSGQQVGSTGSTLTGLPKQVEDVVMGEILDATANSDEADGAE